MKVLVLNGSPKEKSSTMLLTNAFIDGLNQNEENDVKVITSSKMNIKYCMGDLSCWMRQDGHCIIQDDDMNAILDEIKNSDIIIWSFPLHCHSFPASMKAILDRTIAYLKMNMTSFDTYIDHEKTFDLSSKKNIFIIGGGYPYYPDNFTAIKAQIQTYFKSTDIFCVCETALLEVPAPDLKPLKDNLFAQFQKAGFEYATSSHISPSILDNIEKPLIPNEMYLGIINSLSSSK